LIVVPFSLVQARPLLRATTPPHHIGNPQRRDDGAEIVQTAPILRYRARGASSLGMHQQGRGSVAVIGSKPGRSVRLSGPVRQGRGRFGRAGTEAREPRAVPSAVQAHRTSSTYHVRSPA
jgi:hypothetical protein